VTHQHMQPPPLLLRALRPAILKPNLIVDILPSIWIILLHRVLAITAHNPVSIRHLRFFAGSACPPFNIPPRRGRSGCRRRVWR